MKYLRSLWSYFKKAGRVIGDFIAIVVLFVFYYTVFPIFAIPFRLMVGQFGPVEKKSNWISKDKNLQILDDFQRE